MVAKRTSNQTMEQDLMNSTNTKHEEYEAIETMDISSQLKQQRIFDFYQSIPKPLEKIRNYLNNTFDKAVVKSEQEEKYLNSFKKFCDNFEIVSDKGLGMLMIGNPGTGKTYYSDCIYNQLCSKYKVYRTRLSFLLTEIKDSYSQKEKSEFDIYKRITSADLLILDDLGNENLTESDKNLMFNIIDTAYLNNVSMIVNSNLDYNQLINFLDVKGSDKLIDRLKERCKFFKFDWLSRRREVNQAEFQKLFQECGTSK